MKISGKFEVELQPIDSFAKGENGIQFGRMSIDKTFFGELNAVSKGEMLSAMNTTNGSAGYVAIEQVNGSLSGKKGSFVLQHFGTMDKNNNYLKLEVLTGSGTGELEKLSGSMKIIIEDKQHYYDFEYQLESEFIS